MGAAPATIPTSCKSRSVTSWKFLSPDMLAGTYISYSSWFHFVSSVSTECPVAFLGVICLFLTIVLQLCRRIWVFQPLVSHSLISVILCSHLSSTQNHCLHVLHLLIAEVDHKTLILVLVSLANSWLQILELSKGFYDCC
jgi:hypothetical protein